MAKRLFDICFSLIALLATGWLLVLIYILACIDIRGNGLFLQTRIGRYGKPFTILKIRTIATESGHMSSFGRQLRNFKLDELPQLLNVFFGNMSIVGPRPDIPGYYDRLTGNDRQVLQLRPGITGPASLKYANEEVLLALQKDKVKYNDEVIFPDKVRINLAYLKERSLMLDIEIILRTLLGSKMKKGNLC